MGLGLGLGLGCLLTRLLAPCALVTPSHLEQPPPCDEGFMPPLRALLLLRLMLEPLTRPPRLHHVREAIGCDARLDAEGGGEGRVAEEGQLTCLGAVVVGGGGRCLRRRQGTRQPRLLAREGGRRSGGAVAPGETGGRRLGGGGSRWSISAAFSSQVLDFGSTWDSSGALSVKSTLPSLCVRILGRLRTRIKSERGSLLRERSQPHV